MSDFNFSCPACGGAVSCDSTLSGSEVTCPNCQASIIVPEAPAEAASAPASPNPTTPPPLPAGDIAPAIQRTSKLAVASLVCSFASLVTCIGWLPGIICGHLARSRIRRDKSLKGAGMANAGLIISYLMLVSEIGIAAFLAVRFTSAVKQGIAEVRENLATNVVVTTSTQSATNSYDTDTNELAKPAAVGPDNQGTSPGLAGWKPDLSSVSVPTQPVGGTVRGTDFAVRTATFRNGDLKLTSANDVSVDIFRLGSTIDGMSYNVLPADEGSGIPRVRITWTEDGVVQTATFSKGFAMKLEFSQPQNRRISGKVYVCLPDQSKSWLAGTLDVRLPRQR